MIFVGDYAPEEVLTGIDLETDLLVINLEGPILTETPAAQSHKDTEHQKVGPILHSSNWPEYTGKVLFTLANNHFMDLGNEVARQNIQVIQDLNNLHTGYRSNLSGEENRTLRLSYKGLKVGFLAISENQHGIASKESEGVNGLGHWVFREIKSVRETVDYLILASHAGAEDSPVPLPYFQSLYREFVRCGVDLVIGHHSHVPQGFEKFQNGHIFYGLGNFAVNPARWSSNVEPNFNQISLAVELDFKDGKASIQSYPLAQGLDKRGKISVQKAEPDHQVTRYLELCNEFVHEEFLRDDFWRYFAPFLFRTHSGPMLREFSRIQPHSWIRSITHRLLGYDGAKSAFRKLANDRSKHIVECESHLEVAKIALSQPHYYKRKLRKPENALIKEIISFLPNHN